MINQISNNKPSGYQSINCDAGVPISGRTSDTGSYQILKLNADGSITSASPVAISQYIGVSGTGIGVPAGIPPSNTYVGSSQPISVTETGLYSINPTFVYTGNAGGGISFILYKDTTALWGYISTLPPFNAFASNIGDVATGLFGYWHNTASQIFSSNLMSSFNRNNVQNLYLTTGNYYLAVTTDGAVSFNAGAGIVGFYEFTKIG